MFKALTARRLYKSFGFKKVKMDVLLLSYLELSGYTYLAMSCATENRCSIDGQAGNTSPRLLARHWGPTFPYPKEISAWVMMLTLYRILESKLRINGATAPRPVSLHGVQLNNSSQQPHSPTLSAPVKMNTSCPSKV
jgi:hypothetical protein